jgi:hypothetical protein
VADSYKHGNEPSGSTKGVCVWGGGVLERMSDSTGFSKTLLHGVS